MEDASEAESPCQFPVFQTTHFGALVRLLFHELLGLQSPHQVQIIQLDSERELFLLPVGFLLVSFHSILANIFPALLLIF